MAQLNVHISGIKNIQAYRRELERLLKLDGKRFTIQVDVGFNRSMIPKIQFREISDILAEAHKDIYTASPKGRPFRERVSLARPKIRDLVIKKTDEGERRPVTRTEFVNAVNRDMKIFRGPIADQFTDLMAMGLLGAFEKK